MIQMDPVPLLLEWHPAVVVWTELSRLLLDLFVCRPISVTPLASLITGGVTRTFLSGERTLVPEV